MSRIYLTSPTTFCAWPGGSDTTGDGSASNPWATRSHAWQQVATNYDCGNQPITFSLYPGSGSIVHTDTFCDSLHPPVPLVGARFGNFADPPSVPPPVQFVGCPSNPLNCLIQPALTPGDPLSSTAFAAMQSTSFDLSGFAFDMSNCPSDVLSCGFGGVISLSAGIVFGFQINPYNHWTITQGGAGLVKASYAISPAQIATTATWSAGATVMSVANVTGLVPYMGILGYTPAGTYIVSVNGNQIQVNQSLGAAQTNAPTYFAGGAQDHILCSLGGCVYYETNGVPGLITVTVNDWPNFMGAFIECLDGGRANIESIAFAGNGGGELALGKKFKVGPNGGGINTNGSGPGYLPGTVAGQYLGDGTYY